MDSKTLRSRGSLYHGVAWIVCSVAGYWYSSHFDERIENYAYTAATWPRMLFVLLAMVGIGQVLVACRHADQNANTQDEGAVSYPYLIAATPVLYAVLLNKTGFYLTTPVFLLVFLLLLGERRISRIVSAIALIYSFILVVFCLGLFLPLPVGNWPGFYEANTWIVMTMRGLR